MVKRAKMHIYALKNLFLGHNTAIKVFFGRIICKFSDLSFDFGENWPFFGKSPISRLFLNSFSSCARAARAGYLGEYRSDRSEIFRGDSLRYYQ